MLFSGKIRFHDVARLTARCFLFATYDLPLFATLRRYSPLFETIRAIRYSRLSAIRVFQTPVNESSFNIIVYVNSYLHFSSCLSLKFFLWLTEMLSCFRSLTQSLHRKEKGRRRSFECFSLVLSLLTLFKSS